jgi:hypothetical protein
VFGFELYADLPIVLTIVHCDGTSILSLHTIPGLYAENLHVFLPLIRPINCNIQNLPAWVMLHYFLRGTI